MIDGSRRKAFLKALGSAVFGAVGFWMTGTSGTSRHPTWEIHALGWFVVVAMAANLVSAMLASVQPNRLVIDSTGFRVKRCFRSECSYRWEDIDRLWVFQSKASRTVRFVVWTYTPESGLVTPVRRGRDYDGWLPAAWTLSVDEVAAELSAAKTRALSQG
ncbi:hypothetical protein [Novosphingobium sp. 9]|uniref:hypothetical protein n=1 Tax=Novosphingobium sp. 9 TaxID=2025349 RepID=UPI0021B64BD1|nr:hypothetical protein [Novosphingobium sp. 9]